MLKFLRWLFSRFNLVLATKDEVDSLVTRRTEDLQKAISSLEKSYDLNIEFLGKALDLNEGCTPGHTKRVTAYSIAIGRAMGLSRERIRVIARGAFLQDIGKMSIPDDILRKRGLMDAGEAALMREHCDRGYRMLMNIPFLVDAATIALAHHENFDGTGYPRGLKGEAIPLGARIVAIANALDLITSEAPNRVGLSWSAAREEIRRGSGTQFDPAIVKVFLVMPESVWEDLRRQIKS